MDDLQAKLILASTITALEAERNQLRARVERLRLIVVKETNMLNRWRCDLAGIPETISLINEADEALQADEEAKQDQAADLK